MRTSTLFLGLLASATPLMAQKPAAVSNDPASLKTSVREWIETMQKIQQEEDSWTKDEEVLQGYKDGLEKEIEDLKTQIADARVRKEGGDTQSLDKVAERDRYAAAQNELANQVHLLEQGISKLVPLFPEGLKKSPKVAEGIDTLQAALNQPEEKRSEEVSKRLFSAVEVLAEVEKFQQGVHVHQELRKDSQGQEFNMKTVYFGLAQAYAVNDDGTFAMVGRSGPDGWKFTERNDLASQIQALVASASSEKDASFTILPLIQP
jgi:predicted  nucleic acid-binding Zn-ribbon protein